MVFILENEAQAKITSVNSVFNAIKFSKKKGLGRKLLIAVLLVSSMITLIQTSYQLYSDYKVGLGEIDRKFEQTFLSYKNSIARGIWDIDTRQVKSIAQGIISLPYVEHVEIREVSATKNQRIIQLSTNVVENLTARSFSIQITEDNDLIDIGLLSLKISLAPLYSDLYNKLLVILTFQTIKTFSVSILIFTIFHYLVTQHLIAMASFSKNIRINNLEQLFTLQRKKPNDEDELDAMSDALNSTKTSLKEMLESKQNSLQLQYSLDKEREQKQQQERYKLQTEKRNLELAALIEELKETQEQLVNSEKMAALGNMVQGIAHELNTPIGISITGSSHLKNISQELYDKYKSGEMKRSDLEAFFLESININRSVDLSLEKASSLIKSFKLISAEQHEDVLSSFNVYQNFEDIVYSLRSSVSYANIKIINNIPQDINIISYPGIIYQIYTNLLNNARLHGFKAQGDGKIEIEASLDEEVLNIIFKDNGKGMAADVKKQLFDPFFTTNRGNGGTGLGMNIVMNLITEKLSGKIKVESETNKGTCFKIRIKNHINHKTDPSM